jgi:hypothetical protein
MKTLFITIITVLCFTYSSNSQNIPSFLPSNGLIGYWPFDGSALDQTNNNNHGTVNGASLTADRFGTTGAAYSFDGVNDHISLGNSTIFNLNNFTLSMWAKVDSSMLNRAGTNNGGYLLHKGCDNPFSTGGYSFRMYYQAPFGLTADHFTTNRSLIDTNLTNLFNQWNHLVFTYNGAFLKLYRNGVIVDSISRTGVTSINTQNLILGARHEVINGNCTLDDFFKGKIDDLGIWNRALNNQEIIRLYANCQNASSTSQHLQIGNNQFPSNYTNDNDYGPIRNLINSPASGRWAYIYPDSLCTQVIGSNALITSLSFIRRNQGLFLPYNFAATLKIYLKNSTEIDYGPSNIHWVQKANAAQLVYSGNPKSILCADSGFFTIPLDSAFVYTGNSIEVFIEYVQFSPGIGIQFGYDDNTSVPSYLANTTKYTIGTSSSFSNDSTSLSNLRKPTIRFHYSCSITDLGISLLSNTNPCAGDSILLRANTSSVTSYQWLRNGINVPGATNREFAPSVSGTYSVLMSDSFGCLFSSQLFNLNILPVPQATISPNSIANICQGGSVTLFANTGLGLTYQWKLNGNDISGATSSTFIATQSGGYTVQVTNANNCTKLSQPTTVTVNPLPSANISTSTPTTFCQGDSVVLNGNTGAGLTYQWKLNGSNISGAIASSFTANQTGNYTVLVTDSQSCSSLSQPIAVTVNPLPPATITATTPSSICQGDSVTLNANTGMGLTYQWKLNGNNIVGATSSIYNATQSGDYAVEVIDGNGCKALSSAQSVMVQPSFTGGPIIGQSSNVIPNQPYIYAVSQNPNRSYDWSVTNGALLVGQGTNTITVLWGNFLQGQVRLIETLQLCSDTLELNVVIGQGTSVLETSKSSIQLYPNPTRGTFYLKSDFSLGNVRVLNSLGQTVWREFIEINEHELNLSHLSDGVYQVLVDRQVLRLILRR